MTRERDERWMRCADRDGTPRAIPFDPVVEGARYGLSRELSLALWKLVREEGATAPEQADLERVKLRFHELAAQLAAGGAKLRPDVGRLTRVAVEPDGVPTARAALDALRSQVPGRETKVIVEARRWASLEPQLTAMTQPDAAAPPATRPGLPGVEAVVSALAELSLAAPLRPEVLDVSVASRMSQMFGVDLSGVRITTNSPAATGATKAVTKDGEIHFRAGAYRPGTRDGDWLIAHELAHVVQQRGAGESAVSTKEIEREADRAASLAVRGRVAPIALRAQPAAAYAFSDSEVHEDVDLDDASAHAGGGGGAAAAHGPIIAAAVARRSAGDALPATLRRDMEALLGADLSRVRIHTDAVAGTAARSIRARAFTIGADIFFAPGAFEPTSDAGRELLAHELTHVVQTQDGRVAGGGGGLRISDPDEAAEREAEQVAHRVRSAPRRDLAQSALAFVATAFAPAPAVSHGTAVFRAPATGGGANAVVVPSGGKPVNEIGIVARDQEPQLRMRSSMSTANDSNILATLPFNTRVQVMQAFPGDWLLVATADGRLGYCARQYIWYAPEHKLPEPNAKLHKVAGGTAGFAISIAEHYYGDIANKWGTDLRFFVNVLGAVNHLEVPDTTSGWKTVQFKAGTYIWIPSADFAKSLHGVLNSGSRTYNLASALGIAGFLERVGQLYTDFKDAIALSGKYLPRAIAKHAEDSILGILESLMWMAIGAVALLAITTAIGAAVGALAGGVGAAPGAAAGFEVGLALLDWIGLAFLVKWLGSAIARIGSTFGTFFGAVWNARGDKAAIDEAAQAFAEAIGTLVGVLLEALVMWAISAGVKAAVPKVAETPIGRAFGKTKLSEWLDARIKSYKAGEAPILGPKQALRKLLELRRRGEKGEKGEKPPKTGDAYDKLAEKHGLDDVVTQILREQRIDPARVERLLAKKMDPFDIAETALDFGGEGLRAIETMVNANVQPRGALAVLSMARDMGIGDQVIALVNSGKLENLQGLKKFMTEISQELSQMDPAPGNWHTGKFNELMEAYRRAVEQGHDVSVGGNAAAKGSKPAGKADVVDYTAKQALQSKTVTSPKLENVVENLQKAVDQLNGEHGELPPDGYQRIADIIIENPKNELFQASREQIAAALKGKVHGLEKLSPKDTTPGVVRVKNAISTFLFQPSELR